jgi:hypothetical protein
MLARSGLREAFTCRCTSLLRFTQQCSGKRPAVSSWQAAEDVATRTDRSLQNDVLFRELSARIGSLRLTGETDPWDGRADYLCECADTNCLKLIELDLDEYEHLRSDAGAFIVAPGHEGHDSGRVFARNDRFVLIEKPTTPRPETPESGHATGDRTPSTNPP